MKITLFCVHKIDLWAERKLNCIEIDWLTNEQNFIENKECNV